MTESPKVALGLFSPGVWHGYLRRYAKYRWSLGLSGALSALQSLCLVPLAWLIKVSFDRILSKSGFLALAVPCGLILLLTAVSAAFTLLARHYSLRDTKRVIQDIRLELLAKSYELASAFSTTTDRAMLHTAIVQDTERVDVGSNAVVVIALPAIITSAIFLGALGVLAPWLLLITLAAAPLAVLSDLTFGRRMRELTKQFVVAFGTFDENILAALRRMDLTRVRGAQSFEIERQTAFVDALRRTSAKSAWAATAYNTAQSSIATFVSVITLLVGGTLIALGSMSIGALAAYYFIVSRLGTSLNAIWTVAPQILAGTDSLNNIARVEALPRKTPTGGAILHRLQGSIELRGVRFSYADGPLLAGIDLNVRPGERVAIMGANGSGKTTLAYLMLGFFEPQDGEILVDGLPIGELALDHYRRQIGVVLQDMLLFAGTIFENIAYGHDKPTLDDVHRAATLSRTEGFVHGLADGYDAVLGFSDVALSGGQSQTVGLARALLGRPKLVILDEPTNHLDEAATAALLESLDALEFRPTVILITHERALASRCDRVYRLEEGRLVEVEQPAISKFRVISGDA